MKNPSVQGGFSSAVLHVREFQRRLTEVFELTDAQKYHFHGAAETVIAAIPEEPPGKEP